jgi:hypothetical protein
LTALARKLKASRSIALELLVWQDQAFVMSRLRAQAAELTAQCKDRRYAGKRGWETRRLGGR